MSIHVPRSRSLLFSTSGIRYPTDVSGLSLWLTVKDPTKIVLDTPTTAASWSPSGGTLARAYTQASAIDMPKYTSSATGNIGLDFTGAALGNLVDADTQAFFNTSGGFTCCYLLTPNTTISATKFLYNAGGATEVYHAVTSTNRRYFQYRNAANGVVVVSGAPSNEFTVDEPRWVIYRVTRNGSDVTVDHWMNLVVSTQITASASTGMLTMPRNNFYIGASTIAGASSFDGHIHDIQFYNRPLEYTELLAIYRDYVIANWNMGS